MDKDPELEELLSRFRELVGDVMHVAADIERKVAQAARTTSTTNAEDANKTNDQREAEAFVGRMLDIIKEKNPDAHEQRRDSLVWFAKWAKKEDESALANAMLALLKRPADRALVDAVFANGWVAARRRKPIQTHATRTKNALKEKLSPEERVRWERWLVMLQAAVAVGAFEETAHAETGHAATRAARPILAKGILGALVVAAAFGWWRCAFRPGGMPPTPSAVAGNEQNRGHSSATVPVGDKANSPGARSEGAAGNSAAYCGALDDDYWRKKCVIAVADSTRDKYEQSVALYKQAIAFSYTASGLGTREDVPEAYLSDWQNLDAYDGLASLYSLHKMDKEALAAYRERLRIKDRLLREKPNGVSEFRLYSGECIKLFALELRASGARRALETHDECFAKNPYPESFDRDYHTYELALTYDALDRKTDALAAFAAIVGDNGPGRFDDYKLWPSGRWAYLAGDLPGESRGGVLRMIESLRRDRLAILVDDVAVWSEPGKQDSTRVLGILPMAKAGSGCQAFGVHEPPTVNVRLNGGVTSASIRRNATGLQPFTPDRPLPWRGLAVRQPDAQVVEASVNVTFRASGIDPEGCLDVRKTVRFCLLPDGRLDEAASCRK